MRLQFGRPKIRLTKKYDGRNDPRNNLAKWTKFFGTEPQPKRVHLFCHTLDTIPMNLYLETEVYQSSAEWDILREGYGFECINESLQEIKTTIFRMP